MPNLPYILRILATPVFVPLSSRTRDTHYASHGGRHRVRRGQASEKCDQCSVPAAQDVAYLQAARERVRRHDAAANS